MHAGEHGGLHAGTNAGTPAPLRVAVVGGGWAGLAAAVRATEAGHAVTLFEMAGQLGGRARAVEVDGLELDNGQHILIGAYARTLALMRSVGADLDAVLHRRPLELRYADGRGLAVPPGGGSAALGFARAVAGARGWSWGDKLRFAAVAGGWLLRGFRCDPAWSVERLCAGLPPRVRALMIDPLCVAALNTPARDASATVLLRVLRDGLFGGPGASDLLLPRRSLAELLPRPAAAWLGARGALVRTGARVQRLEAASGPDEATGAAGAGGRWSVDGEPFDAVIVATPPAEAARLVQPVAPAWAEAAAAFRYEPIVTAYIRAAGAHLPAPMTALEEGPAAPAQFAFDHGALGATPGLFAFVVSGAAPWVERGLEATGQALLEQARGVLAGGAAPALVRVLAEKRATFRCTPGLRRPPARIAPGLLAAGDHVDGPYPATLEGAVRAGEAAAAALTSSH
jgi:squalene-associated FAD-dependent desaturase